MFSKETSNKGLAAQGLTEGIVTFQTTEVSLQVKKHQDCVLLTKFWTFPEAKDKLARKLRGEVGVVHHAGGHVRSLREGRAGTEAKRFVRSHYK